MPSWWNADTLVLDTSAERCESSSLSGGTNPHSYEWGFFILVNIYNYEKNCKTNRIRFNKNC